VLILTALAALPALAIAAVTLSGSLTADASPVNAADYTGLALDGEAPDFTLTDQRGTSIGLDELQGRVVLLAFLDPNCTDICPVTARHFRNVYDELGTSASQVALLAVNVSPDQTSVEAVAEASDRWAVGDLASWHFLNGRARGARSGAGGIADGGSGGMSTNYSSADARRRQAMRQVQASHQQRRGPARLRLMVALANRLTRWST